MLIHQAGIKGSLKLVNGTKGLRKLINGMTTINN
jgi:hypothetical protein